MMPGQQPIDWDAAGYPELADAIRKDAGGAVAHGDQADAAEVFAVSELRSIAAEPNAVIIAEATQELSAHIARIVDGHREFRSHGAMLYIGRTGPVQPDPRKPSGVGVFFADDPSFLCDLSPDYPLRGVLHARPADREPAPLCDWRGAYHCTDGRTVIRSHGMHISYLSGVCTYCARSIFEWRWDTVSSWLSRSVSMCRTPCAPVGVA